MNGNYLCLVLARVRAIRLDSRIESERGLELDKLDAWKHVLTGACGHLSSSFNWLVSLVFRTFSFW